MRPVIRGTTAFANLLSLGFATIGVYATLVAIGSQLFDDALSSIGHRPGLNSRSLSSEAPATRNIV